MHRALGVALPGEQRDERREGNTNAQLLALEQQRSGDLRLQLQSLERAAEAEDLHRRALHISETAHDADHPSIALMFDGLGAGLRALGRSAKAEPALRRA